MNANILITAKDGRKFVIKRTDIRRVYESTCKQHTVISFSNPKINSAIWIGISVEDFYSKYLVKK